MEEEAKKRIEYIAKRQELLSSAVGNLQRQLYEAVLADFDKIATDPAELDKLWKKFQASAHSKVILKFASDVMQIGKLNADYFAEIAEDLDSKDYAAIKKTADSYLMDRFGLASNGKAIQNGFLDTFVKDQSILRDLKQYAYKSQVSGIGVDEFKAGFKDMIIGTEAKNGSLMRYYQTFAFDTYQQADATLQDHYAKKLELEAALYLGGEISGTRPFCHERNGKVFLRSEIETWKGLKFAGKPANYDPFQDRGGYNCRHHFNWITNEMAVARRKDLTIGGDGELRVKGSAPVAKVAEFVPAKSLKEAEEFAQSTGLFSEKSNFAGLNLEEANDINSAIFKFKEKLNPDFAFETLSLIRTDKSLHVSARLDGNSIVINPEMARLVDQSSSAYDIERIEKKINRKLNNIDNYSPEEQKEIRQNVKEWQQDIEKLKTVKNFQIDNIEDMITHELGHVVEFRILENPKNFDKINHWADLKYREKNNIEFADLLSARLDGIARKEGNLISEYAAKNSLEYLAEAWLAYSKGSPEAKHINKELLAVFKKITK
jgi:hypothetical protein